MLGVTLAVRSSFVTDSRAPARISAIGLGVEVLAAMVLAAAMLARFAAAATTRCEPGADLVEVVVVLSTVLAPVAGGVVLAALLADARRRDRVLPWHLAVGVGAVVVPLVAVVEAVVFGLTCSGR